MATWVRQGTGTAPSSTDADLTGVYELDNATAPGDFDPAGVTAVRFEYTITGANFGPSSDTWDDFHRANLNRNGAGSALVQVNGSPDTNGNENVGVDTDETGTTILGGPSTADWEGAELGPTSGGAYTLFNQDMGPDGGVQTMSALVITITYTPTGSSLTESKDEAVGVTDSTTSAKTIPRSQDDDADVTDDTSRIAPAVRVQSDDADVTDSTTAAKSITVAITDPVGVTDLTVSQLTIAVAVTDSVGVTDSTTREAPGIREVIEPVGVIDDTLHDDPTLQYIYPDGDILSGGWETAPTSGQDLADQLDEDPPDNTDYIFEEV